MNHSVKLAAAMASACCLLVVTPAANSAGEDPVVEQSKQSGALSSLPRKPLEQRVAVSIYEFHGGAPNVSVAAATDMFTTALIQSGQFRVVERNRLNQTVMHEKQLNSTGVAGGDAAQHQLRGARYIFEGTVSEANVGEQQHQGGVSIGGLNIGGAKSKDTIAVEVRILDADTGDVLDSVSISKAIDSSAVGVGGTAGFASTLASMTGHSASPLTPDVNYQVSHKEGVDRAMRACIETSVLTLIKRLDVSVAAN
jgi:curli biogenesis system outer membrane secretion channel CsgG